MRDLTKSMTTFTWAMSVFGMQQMMNLAGLGGRGQSDQCANSFNHVSQAAADTLGSSLRSIYNAGDRLQSGMVDTLFGGFMSAGMDSNRWIRMGADAMRQATAGACCGSSGQGPMGNVAKPAGTRG
jgi:hypothetical protein